jgi:hypothetical protein
VLESTDPDAPGLLYAFRRAPHVETADGTVVADVVTPATVVARDLDGKPTGDRQYEAALELTLHELGRR